MGYSFLDKENLKRGGPAGGLRYIILYQHQRFTINYASRATATTTTTTTTITPLSGPALTSATTTITPLSGPALTSATTTTGLPSPTQY